MSSRPRHPRRHRRDRRPKPSEATSASREAASPRWAGDLARGAAKSMRAERSCFRAASTAIAISSSARRSASCAPTISIPERCPRRSAARPPSSRSAPSIAADSLAAVLADYQRTGERESRRRLRPAPDHLQPGRANAQRRPARRDRTGHPLVQGLHDLRAPARRRPADPRRDGGRARPVRSSWCTPRTTAYDVAHRPHARPGQYEAALPRGSSHARLRG